MVVGEAPGYDEEQAGVPFIGKSGRELDRMLAEAGLSRPQLRVANVTPYRPLGNDISEFFLTKTEARKTPHLYIGGKYCREEIVEGLQLLRQELLATNPQMVIALGATALWALTGQTAITSWRGSMLQVTPDAPVNLVADAPGAAPITCRVLPTYHPAAILRQWAWRSTAVQDLRRAYAHVNSPWPLPAWDFITSPTFDQAVTFMEEVLRSGKPFAADIETTGHNISLVGIATSQHRALCIPFMTNARADRCYWSREEEQQIVALLRRLLESPCGTIGQNFHYDSQHLLRQMGIYPNVIDDTMWLQHVLFPGTPKSLDYIASLYCKQYIYWKDELKDYRALPTNEEQFRTYNCEDACRTYEVWARLRPLVAKLGLTGPYTFQMSLFNPVLDMMVRGVPVDKARREALAVEVVARMAELESHFENIVGRTVGADPRKAKAWYRSPQQMCKLFYTEMGIKPILNRKTQRPTVDDEALAKIGLHSPALGVLTDWLREYSTLDTYNSTFLASEVDPDGRMRCSYNVAGTETYRFSSSENAFGGGLNLQNIPRDKTINIKGMFVPDPGHTILEFDLSSADLRVVIAEAGAVKLQGILDEGKDVYSMLASNYYQREVAKSSPERQLFKNVTHALDYVAGPQTLAMTYGLEKRTVEAIKHWYFTNVAPEIPKWHGRVMADLRSTRTVRNRFGYRRVYFDRLENILSAATAWIGQSTVGICINHGMMNLRRLPWVTVLLQVHDSLVLQVPTAQCTPENIALIEQALLIPITFPSGVRCIPVGHKRSDKSWGDC